MALCENSASSPAIAIVCGFRQRLFRIRAAGRNEREVFRIFELGIGIEREQADEELAPLHGNGNGRRDHVGRIAADDEVGFVDVEQFGVDAGHGRGIGLVVIMDELDLTSEQSALGIDLFFPDLGAEQRLITVGRQRAGERHAEADLDWRGALRASGFARNDG
jgi:hypothetical protein